MLFLHIFHPLWQSPHSPPKLAIIFNLTATNSIISQCLGKADPNSLSRGRVTPREPSQSCPCHFFHTRYCCISWSFRAPHFPRGCSLNTEIQPEVLGKGLGFLGTKATSSTFSFTELSPQAVDTKPTLGLPPLFHHGSSALQTGTQIQGFNENPAN